MASKKRDQILEAAETLFYEEGFHATGIDRVVSEAGVVRMTLYNHFPSKDDLVTAVLDRRQERFLDSLDRAVADAPPGGAVRALAVAHAQWLVRYNRRGCIFMKALGEYAAHSTEIAARAAAAKTELMERLRAAATADGLGPAAEAVAERVFLVLEGGYAAIATLGPDDAVRATQRTVDTLVSERGGQAP